MDLITLTLLQSFTQLYQDLIQTPIIDFRSTAKVVKFIKNNTFTSSLPKPCLLQELQSNIEKYPAELERL